MAGRETAVVSTALATPLAKGKKKRELTEEQKQANRNSYNLWDIAFSLLVIGIVVAVMINFAG